MDLPNRKVYKTFSLAQFRHEKSPKQQIMATTRISPYRNERKEKKAFAKPLQKRIEKFVRSVDGFQCEQAGLAE